MPIVADIADPARRFSGGARLPVSFAASVFVHLAALGALAVTAGSFDGGMNAYATPADNGLEVVLTPRPVAVDVVPEAPRVVSPPSSPVIVAAAPETARRPPSEPQILTESMGPNPGDVKDGFRPRASVTDRFPMARFGDFLDGDRLAGFPKEVDAPVRLPGELDVPYPPAALAAREEGTILVFAVIGEDGTVIESHLQSEQPSPGLDKAVEEVLARTRFLPAEDGGHPIRFYVTLEFVFRIESPDSANAISRDGAASLTR